MLFTRKQLEWNAWKIFTFNFLIIAAVTWHMCCVFLTVAHSAIYENILLLLLFCFFLISLAFNFFHIHFSYSTISFSFAFIFYYFIFFRYLCSVYKINAFHDGYKLMMVCLCCWNVNWNHVAHVLQAPKINSKCY